MEEEVKKTTKTKTIITLILLIIVIACLLGVFYFLYIQENSTEFKLLGEKTIVLEAGNEYEEAGFLAESNKKNINDKVKVVSNIDTSKVGTYEVVYGLDIDYLNIHQELSRQVEIKDTVKPELNIDSKKEVVVYLDEKYTEPKYTATDNIDGNITDKVNVESNVNTHKLGTYEVNYKVTDSSGNETTDKITVNVKRKKNPYVEVSISKQTLQYYEYGEVVLFSNVVTGINGKTPTGTFKVLNKARDIELRGKDYVSFVNYWIAFKGAAFGFHDASWRSNFGGKIYKTNGSHGCVNMPYSKVKKLYNMISIGTPVYIRN